MPPLKPNKPAADATNRLRGTSKVEISDHSSESDFFDDAAKSERSSVANPVAHSRVEPASTPLRLRAPSDLVDVRLADLQDNLACPRYLHDHLRAVWYSADLKRRMCYYCAESCTDNGYKLIGGFPELEPQGEWLSTASNDSVLYQLNTGQEIILDLAILRCPCGTPFQSSPQSAICSMCCTATCSAACHKTHVQDEGMCVYHLNFIPEARPEIFGCRDIRWCVIERSAPGTYLSRVCGPRYLEAITGQDQNNLLLRRGYGHYGQPLDTMIAAMKPLPHDVQRPLHAFRRNMCQCSNCRSRQPHAHLHAQCDHVKQDQPSELSASHYAQLEALPPAHPLAVASRIGNPAVEKELGRGTRKKVGESEEGLSRGPSAAASPLGGAQNRGSPLASRGGGSVGDSSARQAKPRRTVANLQAGKDGVVPDDEEE